VIERTGLLEWVSEDGRGVGIATYGGQSCRNAPQKAKCTLTVQIGELLIRYV